MGKSFSFEHINREPDDPPTTPLWVASPFQSGGGKPSTGDRFGTPEHTGHRANIRAKRPINMSTDPDPKKASDGKLMRPTMVRESNKGRR